MNESKAEGVFDQAKGKLKQDFGEGTNDQSMANEGAADQVKGNAEESWGSVKDSAQNLTHSNQATETKLNTEQHADSFRNKVTSAAEHLKDSIKGGLDHLEHKANE